MAALARALAFFAPEIEVLEFPAWDCQPYDRVSPHAGVVAQRMTALSRLARIKGRERPRSCSPPSTPRSSACRRASAGRDAVALGRARQHARHGRASRTGSSSTASSRASTVREPGDYAVRGGILDLFAPGMAEPVRLDFFGDTLESIRSFDPETQRTTDQLRALDLVPMTEVQLTTETIRASARLCRGLRRADARRPALRGGERGPPPSRHGALAAAVPRAAGHAVRLCAGRAGRARAAGRGRGARAARRRSRTITRRARRRSTERGAGPPYKPLPPDRLYLAEDEWRERLDARGAGAADAVRGAGRPGRGRSMSARRQGRNFARRARASPARNVFEAVTTHVAGAAGGAASASSSRCGAKARASA